VFSGILCGHFSFYGPNIYTIVPTISELYGLWHLKGGMYAYIKALEKLIYELGGIIETETNIEEILVSDGITTGIKTNNNIEKGI
jgi:phytoene desaturase